MKIGIVGAGSVGSACLLALVMRGAATDIVLVDRTEKRAKAVALDIGYGAPLSPYVALRAGDYEDLAEARVVMITVGVNEKHGGATDRSDPQGRLRLLEKNAAIYREVVPAVVRAAPEAILLVVSDPPDPLADLTRSLAGHDAVLSSGTWLDSLRFRVHVAEQLGVGPGSVEAQIIGEHGTSSVFLWSGVRVGGVPLAACLPQRGRSGPALRDAVEKAVRYANISIIEGNEASQYGIGMVCARIAEAIVRDERIVVPIGRYQPEFDATLSLPSVLGARGVEQVLTPALSPDERQGLERSAATLREARQRIAAG